MKLRLVGGVRLVVAASLAAGLLALGGCASNSAPAYAPAGGAPQQYTGGQVVAEDRMPEAAPAGGAPAASMEPQIARTASMSLVVDDIAKTASALHDLAAKVDGSITNESLSLPTQEGSTSGGASRVQVTVPSSRLDEAMTSIAELGRVTSRQIQAEDVTTQVVDVDARVQTMRDSIARLQDLMKKAGSVAEIANVESQLTQRQADLESLLAQQKVLSQRVATAPITVELRTPFQAPPPAVNGFLPGLQAGWDALVTTGGVALTVLGALLPWLILAAVIVVPIFVVRARRKRARAVPPEPPAAPEAYEAPEAERAPGAAK